MWAYKHVLSCHFPLQDPKVYPRGYGWYPVPLHHSHSGPSWACVVVYGQVAYS